VIKDDTDSIEKSLIEKLQRDDLTSVERENAITSLWDSKRYKTHDDLSRKLGLDRSAISTLIRAKESRDRLGFESRDISTSSLRATEGLSDEPRKKILEKIEQGDLPATHEKVLDIVRKVKEFKEPEQQIEEIDRIVERKEIAEEIEEREHKKDKQIAEGKREPEQIIEIIEPDSNKRMTEHYMDVLREVYGIQANHISNFKTEKVRKEAIGILWDMYNHLVKQLRELGEIEVI
jgi:hypothetical protein